MGGARDLPSRMQTLRGTIDRSYDLLSVDEKVLLARLSVFQGGRTFESAEEICSSGLSIRVIDGLESLLDKSLLFLEKGSRGEPRFLMLETIHEYGREKLAESGEEKELQRRHADYFRKLAEQAEAGISMGKQGYWFERLLSEHDNLRAAQLLGASDTLLKAMGLCLQPPDQPEIDRIEASVREQLSEQAFRSAWEKGQAMSLEQAITFALAD